MINSVIILLSFLALSVFSTIPVLAVTTNWTNTSGGNWSESSNWDNGVPTASDTANITLSGTYTVTSDSQRWVEVLILGGISGAQTLGLTQPLFVSSSTISCQIGAHGILDISNTYLYVIGVYDSAGLDNSGTILLHHDGTIYGYNSFLRNSVDGLIHMYVCGHMQNLYNSWLDNYGIFEVDGGCGTSMVLSIVNRSSGIMTVNDTMFCEYIQNWGSVELEYGATLRVKPIALDWPSQIQNFGLLTMRGNVMIKSHPAWPDIPPLIYNYATMEVVADTSLAIDSVAFYAPFNTSGDTADLRLLSGNLRLINSGLDSLSDSIFVATGCTLSVGSSLFDTSTTVSGNGTIHFYDGFSTAEGNWPFTGGFYFTADSSDTTSLSFNPQPPPSVVLSSLNMATINTEFLISNTDTVTVGSLMHNGGTISGNIVVTNTYQWTEGTFVADTAAEIAIPPGVTLTVSTGGQKTLDSISLNVEGSAVLQDSGLFTLVDSAVINILPAGTLDVGSDFAMTGIGTLYNSGETTFDALTDTILIDVPVINSTIARTPGTIEILSGTVVFGQGGSNDGTVNLQESSEWILSGDYVNNGTITIASGSTLRVLGTFLNDINGIISGNGTLDISNAISFINNGTISPGASPGMLTVNGDLALGSTSHLLFELTGASPSLYDRLVVTGQLDLDGSVEFVLQNGYSPVLQDTLNLLTYGSFSGMFTMYLGTELDDGQSFDLQFGPNGLSGYRCNGDPDITVGTTAIEGVLLTTRDSVFAYEVPIENPGACALDYSAQLLSVDPPIPTWIIISSGSSAHLFHSQSDSIELQVDVFGRSEGSYSALLQILSNVTGSETQNIPMSFDVIDSLDRIQHLVIIRDGASADIRLIWESIFGARSYSVYGDSIAGFTPIPTRLLGTVMTNSYTHINGTSRNKFYYRVTSSTLPPAPASPPDGHIPSQITNPDPYYGDGYSLWR